MEDLFKQIDQLDPIDHEKLVFALTQRLDSLTCQEHPSVVSTPGVCGGAARLIRTRIPVWTIESMRRLGCSDLEILRSYPTLRAEDLVEARRYSAQHREEIERAIRENEEE